MSLRRFPVRLSARRFSDCGEVSEASREVKDGCYKDRKRRADGDKLYYICLVGLLQATWKPTEHFMLNAAPCHIETPWQ